VLFNDDGIANATAGFAFNKTSNTVTVGGNVDAVSFNGNVFGTSVSASGTVTAASTVGGVITGTSTSVTGTQTAASTVGGVITGSSASVTGNVDGGNISTGGQVSATANITGGNVLTGGEISATGNITGGNLILAGAALDTTAGRLTVNSTSADADFAVNGDTLANVFYVDAGTGTASFGSSTQVTNAIVNFATTTSFKTPVGNTLQRPATGVTGMFRFNSTINSLEVYNNNEWQSVGATEFTVIADEQFNGDGSTVAFTLSSTQTTNSCIVSINGVVQIPVLAYAVAGTDPTCVLTFTEAPGPGDIIDVRQLTTTTTVLSISNTIGNAVIAVSDTSSTITMTGDLEVTGNVTILGNVAASQILNGTSAVQIPDPNGNIHFDVNSANDVLNIGQFNSVFSGNIIPSANVTYDLGTATKRWKDLYLSGSTIQLGNSTISANATAIVLTNPAGGQTVMSGATSTSSVAGNITGGNVLSGGQVSAFGNIVTGTDLSFPGRIGVGTISPDCELNILASPQTVSYSITGNSAAVGTEIHISGQDLEQTRITQDSFGINTYVAFTGRAARGTAASPTQTQSGDTLSQFTGRGFANGVQQFGANSSGRIDCVAAENFTDSSRATNMVIFTTATGDITPTAVATFSSAAGLSVAGNVLGGNLNVTGNIVNTGALTIITGSNGNITLAPNGTGNINTGANIMPTANATANIGSATLSYNTIFAKATSAQYADLAEKYTADAEYAPGTVVAFGGTAEVTVNAVEGDTKVAGVVSTNPSYTMNSGLEAEHVATVALTGRVPTMVIGPVRKGDLMVAAGLGRAKASVQPKVGSVIGKALEDFDGAEGVIEVVVGRF
jgi:hypothetical protein